MHTSAVSTYRGVRLQPQTRAVAGSTACGCSLYHIHAVAGLALCPAASEERARVDAHAQRGLRGRRRGDAQPPPPAPHHRRHTRAGRGGRRRGRRCRRCRRRARRSSDEWRDKQLGATPQPHRGSGGLGALDAQPDTRGPSEPERKPLADADDEHLREHLCLQLVRRLLHSLPVSGALGLHAHGRGHGYLHGAHPEAHGRPHSQRLGERCRHLERSRRCAGAAAPPHMSFAPLPAQVQHERGGVAPTMHERARQADEAGLGWHDHQIELAVGRHRAGARRAGTVWDKRQKRAGAPQKTTTWQALLDRHCRGRQRFSALGIQSKLFNAYAYRPAAEEARAWAGRSIGS